MIHVSHSGPLKVNHDGRDLEIPELSEEDSKKYKTLGEAEGIDVYHCLLLGMKYGKDFFKRVCGYRKAAPTQKKTAIRVIFYEEKKEPDPKEKS